MWGISVLHWLFCGLSLHNFCVSANLFTAQLNFLPNYEIVKIVRHYRCFLVRACVLRAAAIQKDFSFSVHGSTEQPAESSSSECCDTDVSWGVLPAEKEESRCKKSSHNDFVVVLNGVLKFHKLQNKRDLKQWNMPQGKMSHQQNSAHSLFSYSFVRMLKYFIIEKSHLYSHYFNQSLLLKTCLLVGYILSIKIDGVQLLLKYKVSIKWEIQTSNTWL